MRATCAANRRQVLQGGAAAVAAALCPAPAIAQNAARIVVIGGGFGGANSARALKALNPKFAITLIAESETYTAFPLSNAVLAAAPTHGPAVRLPEHRGRGRHRRLSGGGRDRPQRQDRAPAQR
jgi:NADH dehydrogenase, FAD-containing subunit